MPIAAAYLGSSLETKDEGMWTMPRLWLGKLLILLRIPGIMVNQSYKAEVTQANVRVHLGPLFSVVTVNGLDVYFHRLTGKIDGVGFSQTLADTPDETP
jgi:hypothetical protein